MLQWALENGCQWSKEALTTAAREGHLSVLQWAMAVGVPWNQRVWEKICASAAEKKYFHIIKWSKDNGFDHWSISVDYILDFDNISSFEKFEEIFQSTDNPSCIWESKHIRRAASKGKLHTVQWLRSKGCAWDNETCAAAALWGHLEVLQWLRSQGCPWDESVCEYAAIHGFIHILEWARANGCPWNSRAFLEAASKGQLAVLKWLRLHGCPWDDGVFEQAAEYGHLHILEWANEVGKPLNEDIYLLAAQYGHFHIVKWARDNGYEKWKDLVHQWVKFNDLQVLKEIQAEFHIGGSSLCIWDARDMAKAVVNSCQIDIFEWLRDNGCDWDERTCAAAVHKGYIHVLKWVRENGCPWDESACYQAAETGRLHILQWLRSHGCPWNEIDCANIAILNSKSDILDWMKAEGFLNIDGDGVGEIGEANEDIITETNTG